MSKVAGNLSLSQDDAVKSDDIQVKDDFNRTASRKMSKRLKSFNEKEAVRKTAKGIQYFFLGLYYMLFINTLLDVLRMHIRNIE